MASQPSDFASTSDDNSILSFFSNILEPGSALKPSFLLITDITFAALLLVLAALVLGTGGNIHTIALFLIACGLWGSIKWFVVELKKAKAEEAARTTQGSVEPKSEQEKKDE